MHDYGRLWHAAKLPNDALRITAIAARADADSLNLAFPFPVPEGVRVDIDQFRRFLNRQQFRKFGIKLHDFVLILFWFRLVLAVLAGTKKGFNLSLLVINSHR
jgi:hypothetical protein